ncbi:MAG: hypothetical protein R3A10_04320 [Caldilineaceae bacterium]
MLANPDAVADSDGEWIEVLARATPRSICPVDTRRFGHGRARHQRRRGRRAGCVRVLGRNADRSANGGVTLAYPHVYSGVSLANIPRTVLLLAQRRGSRPRRLGRASIARASLGW